MGTASREQHRGIPAHRVPPLGPWRKREHARPRRARQHPGNKDKMARLITAMTTVECGIHPQDVPIDEIIAGEHLAWRGKKTETNSLGNILQILAQ